MKLGVAFSAEELEPNAIARYAVEPESIVVRPTPRSRHRNDEGSRAGATAWATGGGLKRFEYERCSGTASASATDRQKAVPLMYIGLGTVVFILVIVLIIYFVRRV